jgi:hypothetical protein
VRDNPSRRRQVGVAEPAERAKGRGGGGFRRGVRVCMWVDWSEGGRRGDGGGGEGRPVILVGRGSVRGGGGSGSERTRDSGGVMSASCVSRGRVTVCHADVSLHVMRTCYCVSRGRVTVSDSGGGVSA